MFLTLLEISIINPVAAMAPTKAVITSMRFDVYPVPAVINIRLIATAILAPEEIPSMYGPAIGLAKYVCKRNPDTARAPPRTNVITVLGSLILAIMFLLLISPPPANNILTTSSKPMFTFPIRIFAKKAVAESSISMANTTVTLLFPLLIICISAFSKTRSKIRRIKL